MSPQAQVLLTGAVELIIALMLIWCGYRAYMRKSAAVGAQKNAVREREQRVNSELLSHLVRMVAEHTRSVQRFQTAMKNTAPSRIASVNADVRLMRDANRHFDEQATEKSAELSLAAVGSPSLFRGVSTTLCDHRQHTMRFDEVLGQLPPDETFDQVHQLTNASLSTILETQCQLEHQLAAAHRQIEQQAARIRSAEEDARVDALTRIPNRRAFEEHLASVQSMFERKGLTYSVLELDIDKFKSFNDTHGHAAGDAVLQVTAKVLQSQLRMSDRVFRVGGEEFVLVLSATGLRQAVIVAERARKRIESSTVHFDGHELRVTASIGIAEAEPRSSAAEVLERADTALYAAKEGGRNRVEVATQNVNENWKRCQQISAASAAEDHR